MSSSFVVPILTVCAGALLSFFLIYYLHHNFVQLGNKSEATNSKIALLEISLTSVKEKIEFILKQIEQIDNDSDLGDFLNSKIKEIEQSITEFSKEITQLDRNSIVRTKDIQSLSDLVKDLSHETEIKFLAQDYHYASALEDIEQLKKKCGIYKDKILKIEFQLEHLQQNLTKKNNEV